MWDPDLRERFSLGLVSGTLVERDRGLARVQHHLLDSTAPQFRLEVRYQSLPYSDALHPCVDNHLEQAAASLLEPPKQDTSDNFRADKCDQMKADLLEKSHRVCWRKAQGLAQTSIAKVQLRWV